MSEEVREFLWGGFHLLLWVLGAVLLLLAGMIVQRLLVYVLDYVVSISVPLSHTHFVRWLMGGAW